VAFHRYHLLIGLVACPCLELGINLLNFADSYEVCAGVIIVEDFHSGDSACAVFFGNEFLADDVS